MWIFLVTEVLFFGGLFLTYTINRHTFSTAFGIGSNTLDITLGAGNTVVLIMSSLTMAMAVWSAQVGKKKLVSIFLIATLGLGTVFLGVKAIEYKQKFDHHLVPGLSFDMKYHPTHPMPGDDLKELVLCESLIHFLLLQGQFLKVIAGHGMRRMVLHVKAEAGDEMVVEFLLVFDGLDAKKDGAKTKRGDQENTDQFLLPDLRGPDGHGHGQTAHNQHNGVAGAQHDVKGIAANAKSGAECMAVYGVGQKEAAEEQDFGDQEDPHAERSGFLLLLEGLKLSVQLSGAMHAVLLFLSQSLAWPRRRTEDGLKAVPTAENTERLIISLSRRERLCARRQSKIRPVLVVVRLPSNFRRDMEIFRGRR